MVLELIKAIKIKNFRLVKNLIKKINLNEIEGEKDANLLLHLAVNSGDKEIIEFLIDAGVKKNEKNPYGFTPLHSAVAQFKNEIVNLLLEKGVKIDEQDKYGFTPLHLAVEGGDIQIIELLIKKGVKINEKNVEGNIPLHLAVERGDKKIVEFLLKNGAQIDEKNEEGNTPLHLAVERGDIQIIELLIKKGAKINETNKEGNTPLHLAVKRGDKEIVKLLVERRGIEIDRENNKGYTALELAIQKNRINIVDLLLKRADVDKRDKFGYSPLHLAAYLGYSVIASFLLKRKAKVDAKSEAGYTPLDLAITKNQRRVVKLLLDSGAQLNQCRSSVLKDSIVQQHPETSEMVELLKKQAKKEVFSFIRDYLKHLCPFIEIDIDVNQNIQLLNKNTSEKLSKEDVVKHLDKITREKFETVYGLFSSLHVVDKDIKSTLEKYRGNSIFKFIRKVFIFLIEACSSKPYVSMTYGLKFFNQLEKSSTGSFLKELEKPQENKPTLQA